MTATSLCGGHNKIKYETKMYCTISIYLYNRESCTNTLLPNAYKASKKRKRGNVMANRLRMNVMFHSYT